MHKSHLLIAAAFYLVPADAKPYQGVQAAQFFREDNNSFKHFTVYNSEIQQINASGKWTRVEHYFYAFDRPLPGSVPHYRLQKTETISSQYFHKSVSRL